MSRRRKELNVAKTLDKYKSRMEALSVEELQELDGCYLTTFDVFSTVSEHAPSSIQSHALVLMHVARAKNVHVKAVTSERKSRGRYICFDLLGEDTRDNARCIYVGKYNFFTGHEQSKWSIQTPDRVFLAAPPPSS